MKKKKVKVVPCEVYSRVVGYYRPVNQWNDGKQQEFKERKTVNLNKITYGRSLSWESPHFSSGEMRVQIPPPV